MGIFAKEPTLEELQETTERNAEKVRNAQLELTLAEKRFALQKLKDAGLSSNSFGSWREIWRWVKGH